MQLLQAECGYAIFVPDIPFELTYSKTKLFTRIKLLLQLPQMLLQVYREHRLLAELVEQYKIDLVIADNRYGFYHQTVPSVFITHQLNIQLPFAAWPVNVINHYLIKKFDCCWVPDFEPEIQKLAGRLSQNKSHLKHVRYIGPLSRVEAIEVGVEKNAPVLYLLSGIEPQRSQLEKIIIDFHQQNPHEAILVRGTNDLKNAPLSSVGLSIYNLCDAEQLQKLVKMSKYIVCRSGYSSIMDLVKWKKNAVLIPTPGQFEQEYLAAYLCKKKFFYSISQQQFLTFREKDMGAYQCPDAVLPLQDFVKLAESIF